MDVICWATEMLRLFITEQEEYYKLKKAPVYLGKAKIIFQHLLVFVEGIIVKISFCKEQKWGLEILWLIHKRTRV